MRSQVEQPTRVERIRRAKGIPQYVLAAYARVSPSAICAWERWGAIPKREIVERVAKVLEVEPEELLEEEVNDA